MKLVPTYLGFTLKGQFIMHVTCFTSEQFDQLPNKI